MTEMLKPKSMPLTELTAISPVDGRYGKRTEELRPLVSEFALIKTRLDIEAKYLIALSDVGVARSLTPEEKEKLNSLGENINLEDAEKVKKIEEETRHDVKAMERTFRNMLSGTSLEDITEMIHFGLTSEDINNISYRLMLKEATQNATIPALERVIDNLIEKAEEHKETPMLARTHGQAAVPTTLGKEIINFAARINKQTQSLKTRNLNGKLNGAVGNFNALQLAHPEVDWTKFSEKFIKSLGFEPNLTTTQINPYEDVIEYLQNHQRINGIFVDLNQDMWRYISDNWFIQKVKKGEVSSSTMPQKVNPIDFENSEGNVQIGNSLIQGFSSKLAVSRLQRDLSDSTTSRNFGLALAFGLIGYKSTLNGLERISANSTKIKEALNNDWSILAEGAQTILRESGVEDPYSLISSLTRGGHIGGQEEWIKLVDGLEINEDTKDAIKKLTPENYIGLAVELTEKAIAEIKSSRK